MKRFVTGALEWAFGTIIGGVFVLAVVFIADPGAGYCESMGYVLQSIGE
jgi:hypothetical protein